ncbi:MAG: homoserine kinase [Methanobacteriota archaeon]
MPGRRVRIEAPATIGNFGPGFDVCALALASLGDVVTLEPAARDEIVLSGAGASGVPTEWGKNVVGAVLDVLRWRSGIEDRLRVRIRKAMPPGSGLGSSASSSGGAALAFHALYGRRAKRSPADLVDAASWGEARVSGRHYDDVAAVVLGGLAIVRGEGPDGLRLSRVPPPRDLHIAILRPHVRLDTHEMRRILPRKVPRADAVANLANVALLVDAMHRGDVDAVGHAIDDRIATPARSRRIRGFAEIRDAALSAGASGCGISGSGPALFAVTDSGARAASVARAMAAAARSKRVPATAFAARPERKVMHDAVLL